MNKEELIKNIFQTKKGIMYPKDLLNKGYLIFYPSEGFYLTEIQYDIFMKELKTLNLIEKIIGIDIEFLDDNEELAVDESRNLEPFNYDNYKGNLMLFENCIIDNELRWSICLYQDFWGIIYGPKELLEKVSMQYDFKKDLKLFEKEILSEIKKEKTTKLFKKLINSSYINSIKDKNDIN